MKPLEHISLLRGGLDDEKAFASHLDDFAENHHRGLDQWFEQEWAQLLLAESRTEKNNALDNLAAQYERIEFQEKNDEDRT